MHRACAHRRMLRRCSQGWLYQARIRRNGPGSRSLPDSSGEENCYSDEAAHRVERCSRPPAGGPEATMLPLPRVGPCGCAVPVVGRPQPRLLPVRTDRPRGIRMHTGTAMRRLRLRRETSGTHFGGQGLCKAPEKTKERGRRCTRGRTRCCRPKSTRRDDDSDGRPASVGHKEDRGFMKNRACR